jgi:hexosaminidase
MQTRPTPSLSSHWHSEESAESVVLPVPGIDTAYIGSSTQIPSQIRIVVMHRISVALVSLVIFAPSVLGQALIPYPVEMNWNRGGHDGFDVPDEHFAIHVTDLDPQTVRLAHELAQVIESHFGLYPMVRRAAANPRSGIVFGRVDDTQLGTEGYRLTLGDRLGHITAPEAAGLFYGIQSFRQILALSIIPSPRRHSAERRVLIGIPPVNITDYPRFEWRGAMLDVARHFHDVETVKQVIDYLAMYKMNRLHLHLSDDQGWRIEIKSWPNLTEHGGSTQVGGGPGGYFTQDDYREIVRYASERFITIVPEIDMPGHTNAALASYPELNCDGVAPELYTGIRVGFSSLCVDEEITYQFVWDVLSEIASMTPTPYLHIGGDEVETLTQDQYNMFIERVQQKVHRLGKTMIGWDEIAAAELDPTSIVQHWRPRAATEELRGAERYIMSPADRAYLDMKYDSTTVLGLSWAGFIDAEHGYSWDPAEIRVGITEDMILGVESPLWTETVESLGHIQYMFFPRLPGYAEMGWTPQSRRDWNGYRERLARHGTWWRSKGIDFHRDPGVEWE